MMSLRAQLLVTLSILAFLSQGQNLVPNNSFEHYNKCPDDYSKHYYQKQVALWQSPNAGTPDYFNACSYKCGVPLNWIGSAEAFDGEAYMGLIASMRQLDRNQIAYREYIQIKLKEPLVKGKSYFASVQIRLGLSCTEACNGLGLYFSSNQLLSGETINYPVNPQVFSDKIVVDKDAWTQICGNFVAQGDELFLTIGNFLSNQQMMFRHLDENLIKTHFINPIAYYYIDDVKVIAYSDSLTFDCATATLEKTKNFEGKLEQETVLILSNLYFDSDNAIILKESYRELDQLAFALKTNIQRKITIKGHTDNTGSADHNQKLSEDRANAVRNYLIGKGISKFRIATVGFGATMPIETNETEEGKQLNRRVEIEVH